MNDFSASFTKTSTYFDFFVKDIFVREKWNLIDFF